MKVSHNLTNPSPSPPPNRNYWQLTRILSLCTIYTNSRQIKYARDISL